MNGKKYIIAALSALLTIFTLPFSAAGQSKYRDVSAGLFHVLTLKTMAPYGPWEPTDMAS